MTPRESPQKSYSDGFLAQLLIAIGRVESKMDQQLRSQDMLIQTLRNSSMGCRYPSQSPSTSTGTPAGRIGTQILDRVFTIVPIVWQVILWLVPRLVIGWGLAEGWATAAWHWVLAAIKAGL